MSKSSSALIFLFIVAASVQPSYAQQEDWGARWRSADRPTRDAFLQNFFEHVAANTSQRSEAFRVCAASQKLTAKALEKELDAYYKAQNNSCHDPKYIVADLAGWICSSELQASGVAPLPMEARCKG